MLERDTGWRQGDLLTRKAAVQLRLVDADDDQHFVVIISHDCDIPNEKEQWIEVIVSGVVQSGKSDPQLSHAKNPRRLHLIYQTIDAGSLVLELRQAEKKTIAREDFKQHAIRHPAALSHESKRAMKQWLAARYGRPAFPDAFERRLGKKVGKREVKRHIAKILAPQSQHLVGLFFDLGEQRGAELSGEEPYGLSISIAYDAVEGGPAAREAAEDIARQLRDLFEKAYGTPATATEIALDACEAVADVDITLADLRRVDQWRLEYISLADEESGDFLTVGEQPA